MGDGAVLVAAWDVLVVVSIVAGALALRRRAQRRRRTAGRPPLSLWQELRWLAVLVGPWLLLLALGAYAINRHCYEDDLLIAELASGATADEYCSAMLHDEFPGTLVAVSSVLGVVAALWTGIVLVARARERRATAAARPAR